MTFSSMVDFIHCFQNSCAYSGKLEPSLKVSTVLKNFVTPKISAMKKPEGVKMSFKSFEG